MTTVFKSTGVIPDSVKSNFRRYGLDGVLTDGSKFIFDALDPNTWPKQTNPISGDTLTNLVSGGAPATFNAAPPAFSSGGFVLPGGGGTANIRLPTSGKVASDAAKFLAIYWLFHGTQTQTSGGHFVAGIGGAASTMQHGVSMTGSGSNGILSFIVNGQSVATLAGVAAQMLQIALALSKDTSGRYVLQAFKNGVEIGNVTQSVAVTSIVQPGQTIPTVGAYAAVGGDALSNGTWVGRWHRSDFDDLSGGDKASDLVMLDYELNASRMGL